ncbi:spectrin binding protein [Aureococcus anophagefferens]|uniref:Spectrin binding protein n=1 Tax=Aureococcus anophagefferens TaxID=44056 RepID=A0ABR1G1N6_AURAN
MADEMLDVERQVDADGNVYYVNAMAIHDARGRSFLAQVQHDHASGDDLDALVYLSLYGKAVLLLDAGARVDERDERGQTALHEAAVFGRLAICKLLLSRGASLDARDNSGEDPEAVARRNGKTTAADLLSAVRAAGSLRAYVAASRVQLLVLRILCEKGRASSPDTFLARRLFPCEPERRAPLRIHSRYARAALPKELFWHIVQFWRSDRDI